MGRKETVELTNMCMVEDGKGNVLVQNRLDPNWSGIVYPGGHVEAGESIAASVIREIREETGLTIENPTLCGVKSSGLITACGTLCFCSARINLRASCTAPKKAMRSGCRGKSFSSTGRWKALRVWCTFLRRRNAVKFIIKTAKRILHDLKFEFGRKIW